MLLILHISQVLVDVKNIGLVVNKRIQCYGPVGLDRPTGPAGVYSVVQPLFLAENTMSIGTASIAAAGTFSSGDYAKLLTIQSGAAVVSVGAAEPLSSSGGQNPVISIPSLSASLAAKADDVSVLHLAGVSETVSTSKVFSVAQRFGTVGAPSADALIDMVSTTQGLGIPFMTNAQRAAISTSRATICVYCTDAPVGYWVTQDGAWNRLDVQSFMFGASNSGTSTALRYLLPGYSSTAVNTAPIPQRTASKRTLQNLYMCASAAGVGAGSLTYTVYVGSSVAALTASALSVVVGATSLSGQNTSNVVPLSQGDFFLRWFKGGGACSVRPCKSCLDV